MLSQHVIRRTAAHGKRGVVTGARMQSVAAGAAMLEQGGNAVDAAVAAALVAGVVEPIETTLGGSGFMLVSIPGTARVQSIDFGPRAPLQARSDMFEIDVDRRGAPGISVSSVINDANVKGIKSIGVPATIAGLAIALERFGKLSLRTVLEPAIRAAYDGFDCDPYYSLLALSNLAAIRDDAGARSVFLVDGLPPDSAFLGRASLGVPNIVKQTALGRTLEMIAHQGASVFYEGAVGESLLTSVKELGGLLSREDLLQCRPSIADARRIRYRDVDVWASHGVCGAITELQILQIWQKLHPSKSPVGNSPQRLREIAEVMWHAFADRYHWLGDPDFVSVPEAGLLSSDYATLIAEAIQAGEKAPKAPSDGEGPWNYFASRAVHDPWEYEEGYCGEKPIWRPLGASEPTAGTTHVSTMDDTGMAVSITHTAANMFGSKVVCPRTGILFDAAAGWFNAVPGAANSIAGGKRALANMGPLMVTKNGESVAAIGGPGGRRITCALAQVVMNVVDGEMGAEDAVAAPRCDASGPDLLVSERLMPVCTADPYLADIACAVSEQHEGFGYELARPQLALRRPDGTMEGCVDPFSRGYGLGV